jgi:hypothetical protein
VTTPTHPPQVEEIVDRLEAVALLLHGTVSRSEISHAIAGISDVIARLTSPTPAGSDHPYSPGDIEVFGKPPLAGSANDVVLLWHADGVVLRFCRSTSQYEVRTTLFETLLGAGSTADAAMDAARRLTPASEPSHDDGIDEIYWEEQSGHDE